MSQAQHEATNDHLSFSSQQDFFNHLIQNEHFTKVFTGTVMKTMTTQTIKATWEISLNLIFEIAQRTNAS